METGRYSRYDMKIEDYEPAKEIVKNYCACAIIGAEIEIYAQETVRLTDNTRI